VAVICKTSQYDQLLSAIKAGGFTQAERKQLALEVFRTTAEYDLTIANWLGQNNELPEWFGQIWHRENVLRYGENPHQTRKHSLCTQRLSNNCYFGKLQSQW
jgi:phosphoribosylaminoimidazolecarboxamide formyltransferase/IMP cyclohydrolase